MRHSKSIFRQNYEDSIEEIMETFEVNRQNYEDGIVGIMEIFKVNESTGYVYKEKVYYQTNIKKEYYDSKVYGKLYAKYYRDLQEELIERNKENSEKSIENFNLVNRLAKEQNISYGEYSAKEFLEKERLERHKKIIGKFRI